MNDKPIVVGYDDSPDARRALHWAADLAETMTMPLRVVVARGDMYKVSGWADEWTRGLAVEWLDLAAKELAGRDAPDAQMAVVDGLASEVLILESHEASYLVVGSTGRGVVMSVLQGSVSQHVSRHAQCPVVAVRPEETEGSCRVVVGVDGSEASLHALEAALHYAGMHRFVLTALHSPESSRDHGDQSLALARAAEVIARHEGVDAAMIEVEGRPADALVEESRRAVLVVVGSRGMGAFSGMLLGSVSAEVLRRGRCPVAVIR